MNETGFTADFAYGAPPAAGAAISLSIYADRPHLRSVLREDALLAGLSVTGTGRLEDLLEEARPLSDVVMVDCPQVDAQAIAGLSRLDLHAARAGARLIVSTSLDALDAVFSCMDQSAPVLLIDPNRAQRVIALGQVLAGLPAGRVRELSDDDRLMLLRLSEQVGEIAGRIERLSPGGATEAGAFAFGGKAAPPPLAAPKPATPQGLPEARLVRKIIRQRQLRARFFEGELFADPAWDMLLDLAASRVEGKRVSVTSLCIASGVPPTTALRWIGQMVDAGLFMRVCDDADRRRAFIELTQQGVDAIAGYFSEVALVAPVPV